MSSKLPSKRYRWTWFGLARTLFIVMVTVGCGSRTDSVARGSTAVASGPATLGDLVLWLDAQSGVTQSSGAVSAWADQSGNGHDVTQVTPSAQPTYSTSGAGAGGTLPYLTFGANATTSSLGNAVSNLTADSGDVTVVVAANPRATTPSNYVGGTLLGLRESNYSAAFEYTFANNITYVYTGTNVPAVITVGSLPISGAPMVLDYTYHEGSNIGFDLDGTPYPPLAGFSDVAESYDGSTGFTIGDRGYIPGWYWQGDIYEVLVYQGVLTSSNLAAARDYMASKWAVAVVPPASNAPECPTGLVPCGYTCVTAQEESNGCSAVPVPASWQVPAWYIDPANSTGAANDGNSCTAPTAPCLSYAGVQSRWGTSSPRLAQNTTITFLSSQPDDTDPVYFNPYIENAAAVTIQGVLGSAQQVATGSLGGVVSRTRSAGQLLMATLPTGAAAGQLVVNNDRNSRAWVYRSAGGGAWYLSQPVAPSNLTTLTPAEDEGWADNNSVTLYQPVVVDLAQARPVIVGGDPSSNNVNLNVSEVTVADGSIASGSQSPDDLQVGTSVFFADTSIQKVLNVGAGGPALGAAFENVDFTQSVFNTTSQGNASIWAGQTRYGNGQTMSLQGVGIDADFIASGECDLYGGSVGTMFLDTNGIAYVLGTPEFVYSSTGPMAYWGAGAVDVGGKARLEYPPTSTAASVFLQAGGLYLDEAPALLPMSPSASPSTACAVDPSGTWTCGIPLTPANLDAAISAGGFGGTAINPGGASITDQGTVEGTTN